MEPSTIIIIFLVAYSAFVTFLLFVYEGIVRNKRTELSELYTMLYTETYRLLAEEHDENEVEEGR